MPIFIHNVLTRTKEPFVPIREKAVGVYICGVTVYGRCHVGHLRAYLSFDAVLRYLAYRGYLVRYVRNFTDIDDKIIARAREIAAGPEGTWRTAPAYKEYDAAMWWERLEEDARILERAEAEGRPLSLVVADHFIEVFRNEDFGPFDLLPADEEPRVSEHIPQVIAMIEKIMVRGFAYESGGDVYFDVPAYHAQTGSYGKLSGRDYTQLMSGARVRPTDKKRNGPDFALWKCSAADEPGWDSPWGFGRPGWHIECSAMSAEKLGVPFDIHGGGKDLIFPHHENEIAQSEAALESPFCNVWMHNGFVTVDGVKMSKSLGNFITIKDALGMAPPEVWRLLVLSTHYANPIDLSRTREVAGAGEGQTVRGSIDVAWDRLEYFYETLARADALSAGALSEDGAGVDSAPLMTDPRVGRIVGDFHAVMDDDFNTPRAVAVIGEGMKLLNELCDMKAKQIKKLPGGRPSFEKTVRHVAAELREALGVLGLCKGDARQALDSLRGFAASIRQLDVDLIEAKLQERQTARESRDWARSDEVRDELLALGVEVRDTPTGVEWKVLR